MDAFAPPEWQPHCVPPVFDVTFNASQSLILDWRVKDLWSTSPFKASSSLSSLRTTVQVHPSLLGSLEMLTILTHSSHLAAFIFM